MDMDNILNNNEEYNPNKKCRILIVFHDTNVDMLSNKKKRDSVIIKFFIKGWKLNIFFVLIAQSYFAVPKNITLNSTHCFILNDLNKQKLQQMAFNHSSDIGFKNFMHLSKNVLQNHILF